MAFYKDIQFLKQSNSPHFDGTLDPGDITPRSGIYRCKTCGLEVVSEEDNPLPSQHVKPHNGPIRWQLIVAARHQTPVAHALGIKF